MILPYRFISLDLETTGLSPDTDTIIEIAAIAFDIDTREDGTLERVNTVEKTMLIDPARPLLEEVTLITGITTSMLEGKPIWEDVRERVRAFFEADNTIIIGHNVLFDTAMLRTHGIDITHLPALDTFELSEMLSQDQASLNLGFLSDAYGLSSDGIEHRALGDTRLAMKLFMKYLGDIQHLSNRQKSILWLMSEKEETKNTKTILEILNIEYQPYSMKSGYIGQEYIPIGEKVKDRSKKIEATSSIISLNGNPEQEDQFLQEILESHSHTDLLVMEKKTAEFMTEKIKSWGISVMKNRETSSWISFQEIDSLLNQPSWERKMSVLIGKILFWLEDTETGLIDELKFYGKEYEYLPWFRLQEDETHIFRNSYIREKSSIQCTISDIYTYENTEKEALIIKDITLIEEKIRRKESIRIEFDLLDTYLSTLDTSKVPQDIRDALSFIASVYENVPDRPKGTNPYPPGEYGETYFIPQSLLWHSWQKWLVHGTMKLQEAYTLWKDARHILTRHDRIKCQYIDRSVDALIQYSTFKDTNRNSILEIQKWKTTLNIITRDIRESIQSGILSPAEHTYLYGYGVWGKIIQNFLQEESGIDADRVDIRHPYNREILFASEIKMLDWGEVILTTSLKHIREIGMQAKKSGKKVLMQGISGGKGKMMNIFSQDPNNTILIGLIDTWRDEYPLWKKVKKVILAKVPFDPPTDPYYLARTVGMKNNFSLYSEPMVIIRINTLVGRIRSSGFTGIIVCTDDRIQISEWGKWIAHELL
jgi:DNA polymerase III epsilon subunit-like protein